jgi:3-methylcrotonyl-CoA carboxylase alpha subunit
VYAEDPANNFFPCIGTITKWKQSNIPGIRYDTGIESGSAISIYYDPMVSKVISFAETREIAINKMIKALHETVILGLKTNKRFLQQLLAHPNFRDGKFDTHFIQNYFPDKVIKQPFPVAESAVIAGFLYEWAVRNSARVLLKNLPPGYRNNPYKFQQTTLIDVDTNKEYVIEYNYTSNRFK